MKRVIVKFMKDSDLTESMKLIPPTRVDPVRMW